MEAVDAELQLLGTPSCSTGILMVDTKRVMAQTTLNPLWRNWCKPFTGVQEISTKLSPGVCYEDVGILLVAKRGSEYGF